MMTVGRAKWLVAVMAALATCPAVAQPVPAPVADHHQHLFSPALADRMNGSLSKEVAVPPAIAALLAKRERAWDNRAALRRLYVADAQTLGFERHGWMQGADKVAELMAMSFAGPIDLVPVQVRVRGTRADLAGYYMIGSGAQRTIDSYFDMALEQGPGGWKIVRETAINTVKPLQAPITADRLIALLDKAGIRKAAVLSEAFWWDSPFLGTKDPLTKVRAENDWTAAEAGKYPDRLYAYCSFNPLANYALAELDRCADSGKFRGLKLAMGMSGVDLTKTEHLAALKQIFARANARRLPITIHLESGGGYGATHARLFVDELLPLARDIDVQVAHLWGGAALSKPALDVLVEAVRRKAPGTERLSFDMAEIWTAGSPEALAQAAEAIRAIGIERMRFGSDAAFNGRLTPAEAWKKLQADIALDPADYARIAAQVSPALN